MHLVLTVLVVVGLSACSECGRGQQTVDTMVVDDASNKDATNIDAGDGPISVTVYDNNSAVVPNVPVLFMNANDDVIATAMTDAMGIAVASVPVGTNVTVLRPPQPQSYLHYFYTYLGAKPGDHLVVGAPPMQPFSNAQIQLPTYAGATDYEVVPSCGIPTAGIAANTTAPLHITCSQADIYARARDNGQRTVAWLFVPNVPVAPGLLVDLSNQTFQPPTTINVTVDGVRSDVVGSVFLTGQVVRNGFAFEYNLGATLGSGATRSGSVAVPMVSGGDLYITTSMQVTNGSKERILDRVPFTTSYALDLSSSQTPWLDYATIDPNLSHVTLHLTGTGSMDFACTTVNSQRGTTLVVNWTLCGPYDPSGQRIPTLPPNLSTYQPQSGDAVSVGAYVGRLVGGWDAVRNTVMNQFAQAGFYIAANHDDAALSGGL